MTAFTEFISSWAAVRPSNCLNYPSLSLSLPPPSFPLFEAGYPSWPCRRRRPSFTLDVRSIIRPRGREPRLESWGGEDAARVRRVRSRKTFIIPCETVRLLLRAGILKKDDLERGSAMICAGRGYPRVGTACDRRKNARDRNKGGKDVRVCAHKRRRGREGRRNGICAHKRTSVIGILTASTNGEPRDMRLLACGSLGYEKEGGV